MEKRHEDKPRYQKLAGRRRHIITAEQAFPSRNRDNQRNHRLLTGVNPMKETRPATSVRRKGKTSRLRYIHRVRLGKAYGSVDATL